MSALTRMLAARAEALTWLPEFNVLLFAFLLNLPWEFIQVPLFEGMTTKPHWEAVKGCTRAALGDAAIMLVAYWGVAAMCEGRCWITKPIQRTLWTLLSICVCIAIAIEWLALRGHWLATWRYSATMPVIPGLNVGLVPVLQWVVLPPLVTWLTERQLRGQTTLS